MKTVTLIVLVLLSATCTTAFAYGVNGNFMNIAKLITLFVYVAALVCAILTVVKFIAYKKNPQRTRLRTPIIFLILCVVAFYIPSMFQRSGQTMFGGEGTVASTEGIGSVAAQVSSPSWFGSAPASQADYAPSTKSAYVPPSQADRSQADNKSELLAIQNNSLQHLDIIRHFSLSLTADDPDKALTQIRDITNNNDGTVISSEVSLYGNTYYVGSMDISVPEEKVNDVIDAIQRLNVAFEVENITTEEVTSQHMDLEANINLNQVVQAQYVDLLNQAKGVDDVLQLTDTVANVQAQIQALTANLSQLTKDIHYVKIHISVNPVIIIAVQASGWMIYDTFLQATDTLVAALECLAELSIWFVIYLCPLMLLVTILFYLFRPISRKVSVYYGSFRKNNDND